MLPHENEEDPSTTVEDGAYYALVERVALRDLALPAVRCAACEEEISVALVEAEAAKHPFAYFAPSGCPNGQRLLSLGDPPTVVAETCPGLGQAVLRALTCRALRRR